MGTKRVVIIGAGMTGLVAAGSLADSGWMVQLVEAGDMVGGRMATCRVAGQDFDGGAQFFSVREPVFAAMVQRWIAAGVVKPWCQGFSQYQAGSLQPAQHDGFPRYHVPGGMRRLAEHLVGPLRVRVGTVVRTVDVIDGHVRLTVQGAGGPGIITADAVILTPPTPLSLAMVAAGTQERPLTQDLRARLASIRYVPCLCLMLDFAHATTQAIPAPGGMRVDDQTITWMASQRAKGMRTTGEGIVAHAHPAWSAAHVELDDAALEVLLMAAAQRILADLGTGDWRVASGMHIDRWQHSLATETVEDACIVADLGAPVLFAGDAFGNRPRIEGAALSGLAAAAALAQSLG
jgi:renalase